MADVNHDGTVGTVDLFPKYVVNNGMIFGDDNYYSGSDLRSWLTGAFHNGFTEEVKNALKVQSFPSDGSTLYDKVKCPSLNEVGLTFSKYLSYEGTIYPIFGDTLIHGINDLSEYTTTDGSEVFYWTRSRYAVAPSAATSPSVWIVLGYGSIDNCGAPDYPCGVVACLRF